MAEGLTPGPIGLYATLPGPYGRVCRGRDRTVVELRGEIDIAATTPVGPCLDGITAIPAHQVVVDLTRVDFFDCSGLALLCRAHRRTAEHGGRLWVVCDRPATLRVFRAGGLRDTFRTLPTLAEALAVRDEPPPRADGA